MVDIGRLITTRDRISPLSNTGDLVDIPTQVAYREYLRFLTIQILSVNVTALALSPSWYIDQLWHSHILDTEAYAQLREKWPGRLQHDPVPTGDDVGQRGRLRRTLEIYEKLFKESPLRSAATKAIWSETTQSSSGSTAQALPAAVTTPQARSNINLEVQPPPYTIPHHRFPIFLRESTGRTLTIEGSRMMTIAELKNSYTMRGGPPVDAMILSFGGESLEDTRTLEQYNIQKGTTISSRIVLRGC